MRLPEVTIALLDELLAIGVLVLAPTILAYKFNVIGLEEALVVAFILIAVVAFIVYKVVEVHRREVKVGIETYIGKKATVVEVKGSKLTIMVEGELWNAEYEDSAEVKPGDQVVIVRFSEGRFIVRKAGYQHRVF
jgi:membrane protein implicated in regulation of membrane protease activity